MIIVNCLSDDRCRRDRMTSLNSANMSVLTYKYMYGCDIEPVMMIHITRTYIRMWAGVNNMHFRFFIQLFLLSVC